MTDQVNKRVPLGESLRECNYRDVHVALTSLADAAEAMLSAGGWCSVATGEGKAAATLEKCAAMARVTLRCVERPRAATAAKETQS